MPQVHRRVDSVSRRPRERNEVINEAGVVRIKISRSSWNFQGWRLATSLPSRRRKQEAGDENSISGVGVGARRDGKGWLGRWWQEVAAEERGEGARADDEPALGGDAAVHYRDFFPHDIPRRTWKERAVGWFQMILDFSGVNKKGSKYPGKVKWISLATFLCLLSCWWPFSFFFFTSAPIPV